VLGFLPPTALIAMPVLYAAGDVPVWQVVVAAVLGDEGHRSREGFALPAMALTAIAGDCWRALTASTADAGVPRL
jgi:hypothetical protein